MFQRIKGAIDNRIAEEQARQKANASTATPGPTRSASAARRSISSRTDSPSARPRLKAKDYAGVPNGPAPSEFETSFAIEDESEESPKVGTPSNMDEKAALKGEDNPAPVNGSEHGSEKEPELPADVKARLRKLDKMEVRYQGMVSKGYSTTSANLLQSY
jgi:hypothetical protein